MTDEHDEHPAGLHISEIQRGRWAGQWGVFDGDKRVSERPLNEDEAKALLASMLEEKAVAEVAAEKETAKPSDLITLILLRDYWPADDVRVKTGEKIDVAPREAIRLVQKGIAREESIAD